MKTLTATMNLLRKEVKKKYNLKGYKNFDYYKNQLRGLSALEASLDRIHDRNVNKIGRQRAQSGLYSNSRDACESFRVKGINDDY